MQLLRMTKGYFAQVDDDVFVWAQHFTWIANITKTSHTVYARRHETVDRQKKSFYLHREITDAQPGQDVDHIDGDGLNNQRANLRICTGSQNIANARPRVGGTSKYKGVSRHSLKWKARVRVNRTQIHLGTFASEEDAAKAYDEAARRHQGEFAFLNFPLSVA